MCIPTLIDMTFIGFQARYTLIVKSILRPKVFTGQNFSQQNCPLDYCADSEERLGVRVDL